MGGSLARFQPGMQETRFSSKVRSQMGLESQKRKSEPESVGEEDYRFQRQEVVPKAGLFLFLSFSISFSFLSSSTQVHGWAGPS